ncbi:hypothetical protein ACS0TY_022012 [Phlomoides rotata]
MAEDDSSSISRLCALLLPKLDVELPRLLSPLIAEATRDHHDSPDSLGPRMELPSIPASAGGHLDIPDSRAIAPNLSLSPKITLIVFPGIMGTQPHAACMGSMGGTSSDPSTVPSPIIQTEVTTAKPLQKLTYAGAVVNRNREEISTEVIQAMKPIRKGQYLTVKVDESLYKKGVSELRDSLIGRIINVKGDKPLGHEALVTRLGDLWNIRTPWSMIPIGEGYYSIQFSCDEDRERIFARRSWQLKPAWIRISELPLEYWNKHIIIALASSVGTVIKIDGQTLGRTMGRFAHVLVELDLKQDREEFLMFERAGHCSFVGIHYEHLLDFCKFCNIIEHATRYFGGHNSRSKYGKAVAYLTTTLPKGDDPKDPSKGTVGGTKQWVQRTFHTAPEGESDRYRPKGSEDGSRVEIPCHNSFDVLANNTGWTNRWMDPTLVHLPPIEVDEDPVDKSQRDTGGVATEEPSRGRKHKTQLVTKEYNLRHKHSDDYTEMVFPPIGRGLCTLGFIHVASDYVGRRDLWQFIYGLHYSNLCLIGDFNVELLFEVEAVGAGFTWALRRSGHDLIASKLDRVLAHESFIDHWDSVSATVLAHAASDHHPLLLHCVLGSQRLPRPFKFMSPWTTDSRFPKLVSHSWSQSLRAPDPITLVICKLQRLKQELKVWNKEVFGLMSNNITAVKQILFDVQAQVYFLGDSAELFYKEIDATVTLHRLLSQEHMFYAQKNRAKWLIDGDRNTSFFQRLHIIKKARPGIHVMFVDGQLSTDLGIIRSHIEQFYATLFSVPAAPCELGVVRELITPSVTAVQCHGLTGIPSFDEVKIQFVGRQCTGSRWLWWSVLSSHVGPHCR